MLVLFQSANIGKNKGKSNKQASKVGSVSKIEPKIIAQIKFKMSLFYNLFF